MQWLTQNWIWIVFIIGIFLLMRRGGMGCGMGHSGHGGQEQPPSGQDHDHNPPSALKDAVTGEVVSAETALTSAYQGRVYYFASKENRERFEAAPAQYDSSAHDESGGHRHHRHGC
jgi:YHS domain-containing protein